MQSAYNAEEIKQLLNGLNLQGYRVEEEKTFLNIISGLPAREEKPPHPAREMTTENAENQSA